MPVERWKRYKKEWRKFVHRVRRIRTVQQLERKLVEMMKEIEEVARIKKTESCWMENYWIVLNVPGDFVMNDWYKKCGDIEREL